MTTSPAPPSVAASGFFVFRTPLLPFDELLAWSATLAAPRALDDSACLDAALATDRTTLRARLAAVVTRPEVREALFVASPSLEESLDLWLREPDCDRGQRVERAVVRYFARMAGRATPFGLFAGCSVGTFGDETRLATSASTVALRHTRLDMDYLFALVDALAHDQTLRRAFVYRPNSSLYRMAGHYRYVESRLDNTRRSYHLVSVEATEALDATLERARDGATIDTLGAALVCADVSRAEADAFISDLVESQILVPNVAVPVTGGDSVDVVVEELGAHAATTAIAQALSGARRSFADFDATGLGVAPARYRSAARMLEPLPVKAPLERLFQVDLMKRAENATLGQPVIDEIVAGVEILRRVCRPHSHDSLRVFREAFVDRYEEREIPLVEALDEETGLGFGSSGETSPLLHELTFPAAVDEDVPWTGRERFLLRRLSEALARGDHEIRLEPQDIDKLAAKEPASLPDAFAVVAAVAASDETALASKDLLVRIDGLHGPSGAPLLGRFCHADAELRRHVEAHLRAEEALDPDALFVEIVHLPQGRLGNILFRPILRAHEIPYLGRSGADRERQIPITDLMVSVVGERIVVRSASRGRRIVPRLTTAHNFGFDSVAMYRFLCALQSQEAGGLAWDWGPLAHAPFLPRIVTRRLVLARARWRVEKEEIARLSRLGGRALFEAVRAWRAERRLPRWVVLADADNTLPVDLDNILSIESFAHVLREREEAFLLELFPTADQLCARGPEGRFVHELVVPFVQSRQANLSRPPANGDAARSMLPANRSSAAASGPQLAERRSFPPGSGWLYVKLYSGTATADEVLRDAIAPVVRKALDGGMADCWFFVRYHDPAPHLRVRFHGRPETLHQGVWPSFQAAVQPFLADGRIWRVTLDTYEREVERYGGPLGIVLAERLFCIDSETALAIVELLDRSDTGLDERWRLALCGMDGLLEDYDFDLEARLKIVSAARSAFAQEFRVDRAFERQLGERFRKERASLSDLLSDARGGAHPLDPGLEALRHRSERWRSVIAELKQCERNGRLTRPCADIARSFLHMHANRLLRSVQRQQELVLYDFLTRHYESKAARMATNKEVRGRGQVAAG